MQRFGAILSSAEAEKTVWKTADETVNNSAVLQDDDTLIMALEATTLYRFEFEFWWSTNDTADFQFIPVYTGTITSRYFINEYSIPAGTTMIREQVLTSFATQNVVAGGGGTHGYARVIGIMLTNASGNLKLQWAQNTADASDTKVLAGSRLTLIKLAAG